jgi:hypothetical protein
LKLGIATINDINEADDEQVSQVYTIKKDIELGSYGKTFLMGIYGFFFSPFFHWKLILKNQNDLAFCTSPTGNRMLRVSSMVKDSVFLMSNKEH